MSRRLRSNFKSGTLSAGVTGGATSLSSAGFASLPAVASPDVLALVLDPEATVGAPEIVHVTAHTGGSTTVTVTRGQESTTARSHSSDVAWVHAPTAYDFELSGTFAARPAAGVADRFYYATDQGIRYRDNGTSWVRTIGGPNEIWVTDYGATPAWANPGATAMAANVTAFNSAITAARTNWTTADAAPFYEPAVIVPGTVAGYRYWVNSPINFERVVLRGRNGSIHGAGGEHHTRVWIDGSQIASGRGTLELANIGVVTAGVAASAGIEGLYVSGLTNAVRNVGRAFLTIRDCELVSNDTSHADRAALYLENCFWIRVERVGMTAGGGTHTVNERCVLMVANNDSGDVQGVSQAMFRDIVFNKGQVRFENRLTAPSGPNSANVQFVDVVSEDCTTQPFIDYRNLNSGVYAHNLQSWTLQHCERADATTSGASFVSMDNGSDSGAASQSGFTDFMIVGCQAYAQYLLRAVHRGFFRNGVILSNQTPSTIVSADTTGLVRGIKVYSDDAAGVVSSQATTPGTTPGVATHFFRGSADTQDRWMLDIGATMWFGPGGSTTPDTRMFRGGAGFMAVPILTKTGSNPSDADYVVAPPNGVVAIRSDGAAGSRIFQRIGGSWTAIA